MIELGVGIDDDLTPREKFFKHFSKQIDNQMIREQTNIQKITQSKFHDFTKTDYKKSDMKVKIDSQEKFSRKELEQKELILKALTSKLQEKLTSYDKVKHEQNSLLKEEKQKQMINDDMRQIVEKNLKKDSQDFLNVLSSKINMNIVPVIATVNQILESNVVDDTKKEDLKVIKTNIYEFLDSASQIAECQKLIRGHQSIHKTIINVNDLLQKICSKQKIITNRPEIKIVIDNNGVETIFCDRYRISYVLNYLIKNSITSSKIDDEIKIVIEKNDDQTSISITDNGKGFSSEFIDDVFSSDKISDPFSKDNQIKTGMIISRIIIHNHEGKFKVTSKPGEKTEVSFTLPNQLNFKTSSK